MLSFVAARSRSCCGQGLNGFAVGMGIMALVSLVARGST